MTAAEIAKNLHYVLRLALLSYLIDFSYFDRGLSLAIDRLIVTLEEGGNG
ncbi:hypothetical protein [Desulfobacca acetoxidans]|uniref:Uncharacterized protein n=1 Tax=Desulfobacca acetoxidans (strain ATCC 700848 / DSM 11109 / ASRB2) TaxID=880072 RepID=F2NG04_DESAR|nr:hypothetical protein [Desulfobacca acetoxidans]AEB08417.1 hypothetical protein Desac_0531 [Desulfobacca acetoxidans DSM 11109]